MTAKLPQQTLDNFNRLWVRTIAQRTITETSLRPTCPLSTRAPHRSHYTFVDDGNIPNNSLPLMLYRGAVDLTGSPDPELIIEKAFAANGWGGMWRNGVYALPTIIP